MPSPTSEFVCTEKVHMKRKETFCGMRFGSRKEFDEHMRKVHGHQKHD